MKQSRKFEFNNHKVNVEFFYAVYFLFPFRKCKLWISKLNHESGESLLMNHRSYQEEVRELSLITSNV